MSAAQGNESLLVTAAEHVIATQFASASELAKVLRVAYPKAARLMGQLEEHGVIGPRIGSKTRAILAQSDDLAGVLNTIRGHR